MPFVFVHINKIKTKQNCQTHKKNNLCTVEPNDRRMSCYGVDRRCGEAAMAAVLWLKKRNVTSEIDNAFAVTFWCASIFHLTVRAGASIETRLFLKWKIRLLKFLSKVLKTTVRWHLKTWVQQLFISSSLPYPSLPLTKTGC